MTMPAFIASRLRDYQIEPAGQLTNGFRKFPAQFDGSDMGVGKSFVAIATALTLGTKPLILCRKAAKPSWRRYLAHFDVDPDTCIITNLEALKGGKKPLGSWQDGRTRTGRKYKKFVWEIPDDTTMVFDEVHGCSGLDSKNGQMLIGAAFQRLWTLLVSATAADSPLKMKAIGFALGLHRVSDFVPWLLAHGCSEGKYDFEFNCDMRPGEYLQWDAKKDKWVKRPDGWLELRKRRAIHMAKIHQAIFPAGKGVRIRKEDVPGFPDNEIIPEAIDFQGATAEIALAYRELEFELKQLRKKFEAGPLLKKTQVKVEMLKLPIISEYARDAVKEGYSVIIFTNFNESLDELSRLLKTDCVIRGEQSEEERARNEERFQSNEEPLIIANNQAGGESLSFHDLEGGHPRLTYIFPTFWANVMRQCSGRAPRNGGKTPVVQRIPFAAGTVEEDALNSVEAKLHQVDIFNNGGDPLAGLTDDDLTAGLPFI